MIAVVAETKDGSARKITLEMLAEARRLADARSAPAVGAIVLGALAPGEADRLASHGADRVFQVEGAALATYAPEAWAEGVRLAVGKAKPEVLLLATGSEVALCVAAHEQLVKEGIKSRVVSMPSWELFEHQPPEYKEAVLPSSVKARVSVEQASTLGWERYVGATGRTIGMRTFGASAPLKDLQKKFGFDPGNVVAAAREQLGKA